MDDCLTQTPPSPPSVAFLFSGVGSNYPGMGRSLYAAEPVFRAAVDACAAACAPYLERPLLDALYPSDGSDALLRRREYHLAAQFTVQAALARLWIARGVQPAYVLGHSIGEYAAAVAAGVFTVADAMRLGSAFSRLLAAHGLTGSMAVVFADAAALASLPAQFDGQVAVVADNGPKSSVIAGAPAAVAAAIDALKRQGVRARLLGVDELVHSPLVAPVLPAFEAEIAAVPLAPARLGYASTVLGRLLAPAEPAAPAYWRAHVAGPVRFAEAMRALEAAGVTVFIELGPSPALLVLGRRCVAPNSPAAWLPSLVRGQDDRQVFAESLAALTPMRASLARPSPAGRARGEDALTRGLSPVNGEGGQDALTRGFSPVNGGGGQDALAPAVTPSPLWGEGAGGEGLLAAPPAERVALFFRQARAILADVAGPAAAAEIHPDVKLADLGLAELGIDSLMIVALRERFRAAYGVDVPLAAVFGFATVGDLFSYLLSLVLNTAPFVAAARAGEREEIEL